MYRGSDFKFFSDIFETMGIGDLFDISTSTRKFIQQNVINEGDGVVSIEIALPGYDKDNIAVEEKDGDIFISSKNLPIDNRNYVTQGIYNNPFKFMISARGLAKLSSVTLVNGILILRFVREEQLPSAKKWEINESLANEKPLRPDSILELSKDLGEQIYNLQNTT